MTQRQLPADIVLGLGCMGMSQWYGPSDATEATATIHAALDQGIRYLDSAEAYGPYTNEELIGRAVRDRRDKAFIATKFGFPMIQPDGTHLEPDSSPKNIRAVVDASLGRLQTDYIDLLYQHRVDGKTPVEEVVGTMAELVDAGKVRHLGLCEVGVETITRAHSVHPLTAVQAEYSLWERNLEADVLPLTEQLGITLVGFCPLGRGYLTAASPTPAALTDDDFRRIDPRFAAGNFDQNQVFVTVLQHHAERLGCTVVQLALAWLLAQPWDIVPIPGTRRRTHLTENLASLTVKLDAAVLASIHAEIDSLSVAGDRYTPAMRKFIDR